MEGHVILRTPLTQALDLAVPVMNAPMAGMPRPTAGGELAAAVARAGGLGLIGAGACSPAQLSAEFGRAQELLGLNPDPQHSAIGVGLISVFTKPEVLQAAIDCQPRVIWLSFGSCEELAPKIKAAGIKLVCQVQTLEQMADVLDLGADVIVAQGHESGGHGASQATSFCLIPEAVDFVGKWCQKAEKARVPVVSAGGVCDSRQIAAVLALGGDGVVMGTRFLATPECDLPAAAKSAVISAGSDASESPATIRTRLYDALSTLPVPWPKDIDGRALRNDFIATYGGRIAAASPADADTLKREAADVIKKSAGDLSVSAVYCGSGVGLVRTMEPAEELVTSLVTGAKAHLQSLVAKL